MKLQVMVLLFLSVTIPKNVAQSMDKKIFKNII